MKLQCDLCREIVTADFAVRDDAIEVFCSACHQVFTARPTRGGAPIVDLAPARAARRAPATGEPTMRCPKCDDPQPAAAACRACGLLQTRFADFTRDRDAHVPPEVAAAWQRLDQAWTDEAAHDAFVRTVAAAMAYPWAALRYREALRLCPDDVRAAEQLARLARMAEATLMASSARKPGAPARPYRGALMMLVALMVVVALGVGYALVTAGQRPAPGPRATPARPGAPAPRAPVPAPRRRLDAGPSVPPPW